MREIEFRGYDDANGEWIYGCLCKNIRGNYGIQVEEGEFKWKHVMCVDPKSIGQYTGLKDKNGVEIYEGDIVKIIDYMSQEHIVVVKYDAKLLQFIFKTVDGHYSNMDTNEVIGNIYEKPELLEG